MMSIESLNELADSTPDSGYTEPGEILYFKFNASVGENLKKLKNHNFKFGYVYSLQINNIEYTRVVAYNKKNDIFYGWIGPDTKTGEDRLVFPYLGHNFSAYLNMPRFNKEGKLKLFREDMRDAARQNCLGRNQIYNLQHVEHVDNLEYYHNFWPVIENPDIEIQRRLKIFRNPENALMYSDAASPCNTYYFDKTYALFDNGLQEIYKIFLEHREELFCREVQSLFNNPEAFQEMLSVLNMDELDIIKKFEEHGLDYGQIKYNSLIPIKKETFLSKWFPSVAYMLTDTTYSKQKTLYKKI